MRIAVIGGGLMGMALAYYLSESSHEITVLEQSAQVGGHHGTLKLDIDLSVGRFQHYILPGDRALLDLIKQLGLADDLQYFPAHSGFIHNGDIHPMKTVWDFLTFAPLRRRDRLRMGHTILQARLAGNWRALDGIPVKEWLIDVGGENNFNLIWSPLLEAKFDNEFDNVPATFIWSWLNRMSATRSGLQMKATISHLRHGPAALIDALASRITARGGSIITNTRVREIEIQDGQLGRLRAHTGVLEFDMVIGAVPTPDFSRLLLSADGRYLQQLEESRYLGLVCPALVLDRPLSNYWTLNLTDPSSPFASIVETPHPLDPRYHIVYLPKYTASGNDWMGVSDETILDAWLLRLRQIYPGFRPEHIIHQAVSRSRYVDPLHALHAADNLPPVLSPYTGLFLANSSQVYPQVATSSAVITHAQTVARMVLAHSQQVLPNHHIAA